MKRLLGRALSGATFAVPFEGYFYINRIYNKFVEYVLNPKLPPLPLEGYLYINRIYKKFVEYFLNPILPPF